MPVLFGRRLRKHLHEPLAKLIFMQMRERIYRQTKRERDVEIYSRHLNRDHQQVRREAGKPMSEAFRTKSGYEENNQREGFFLKECSILYRNHLLVN